MAGLAFQLGCKSIGATSLTGPGSGTAGGNQPVIGTGRSSSCGMVTNEKPRAL